MNDIVLITFEDLVTASGQFPERMNSPELTNEVKANIMELLKKVNPFLLELGVTSVKISSGFRPSAANAAAHGAAKSNHMIGKAVDLHDVNGDLDIKVGLRDDLLKKCGLWRENPMNTIGWCHLDDKDRGTRPSNTFDI